MEHLTTLAFLVKNYLSTVLVVLLCPLVSIAQTLSLPDSLSKYNIDPRTDSIPFETRVEAHLHLAEYGEKNKNLMVSFKAIMMLGVDYYLASEYPEAMEYFERADDLAHELNSAKELAEVQQKKGNLYLRLRQGETALKHYQQYLNLVEESGDSLGIGMGHISIANCYSFKKQLDTAAIYYLKGLSLLEKHGTPSHIAIAASNLAQNYLNRNKPLPAMTYLKRVMKIDRAEGWQRGLAKDMLDLARSYSMAANYKMAKVYFDSALVISRKVNNLELTFTIYSWMAEFDQQKGDYKSAFENFTKYHYLRDSLIGESTQKEIAALKTKYKIGRKEAELQKNKAKIAELERAEADRQLRFWFLITGLCLLAMVAYKFHRDRQRNKKLYAIKQELLQNKLEKEKLQSSWLEERVGLQQQDLTDLALEITRKNAFAEEMLSRLEMLEKNAEPPFKKEVRELKILANNNLQFDKEREALAINVEQVNRAFYQKLNKRFGNLSPNELELCGLIRMNFSNKDIAALKGISANSAKMARYRLRKKLALDPEENIVAFLQEV